MISILHDKELHETLVLAEKPIIAEFEPTFLKQKGKHSNSVQALALQIPSLRMSEALSHFGETFTAISGTL
jgi:hypothetical protein